MFICLQFIATQPCPKPKNVPHTHTHIHIPPCNVVHSRGYPWQVHSSLRSKMTQNSLCLLDLPSPSSLLSVCPRWRLKETSFHPSVFPPLLRPCQATQVTQGDVKWDFASHKFPHVRSSLGMNGTSEWGNQSLWVQGGGGQWVCCILSD